MNVFRNFAKVLSLCMAMAFVTTAYAQEGRWEEVDEVHFTDRKTATAIKNCKIAREADRRCSDSNYNCSPCSEIRHSDHSSYVVYQLARGGWDRPGRPGRPDDGWDRPGRPGRPDRPGYGTPERRFVQTFHFYHEKTAEARKKCETERSRMSECRSSREFECTPCTFESHTDHSQFDLYRIIYR